MRPAAPPRRPLTTATVADPAVDQHLREQREAVEDVRGRSIVNAVLIAGKSLADATATQIRHGLARRPAAVFVSPPRSATATGRIVEGARDDTFVTLTATGHGATITVDLLVVP